MKRRWIIAASLLCVTATAAQVVVEGAYVSNPAVCARANEADLVQVLAEEKAWAVYPTKGILGGEITCYFHDQQTVITSAWAPELLAIARCLGSGTSTIDQIAMAPDSYNINVSAGGNAHGYPLDAFVEVVSMRDESYAGVYTRCQSVEEGMLEWFD